MEQQKPLRTVDVVTTATSAIDIDALFLSPLVTRGLTRAGFVHPSPVQMKAIPLCRAGADVVVQAKSGTGKTCVFAVAMLELVVARMELGSGRTAAALAAAAVRAPNEPLAIAVAPTREIAVQICEVVQLLGAPVLEALRAVLAPARVAPEFLCASFIGGMPVKTDAKRLRKGCLIAVGTPGRLCDLACTPEQVQRSGIEVEKGTWGRGLLSPGAVRMLVLDEADKLIEEFEIELELLSAALPARKQVLAFSATFGGALVDAAQRLMRDPIVQRLCAERDRAFTSNAIKPPSLSDDALTATAPATASVTTTPPPPPSTVVLRGVLQFFRRVHPNYNTNSADAGARGQQKARPTSSGGRAGERKARSKKDGEAKALIEAKLLAVKDLLETQLFEQCFVFSNDPHLGARASVFLNKHGWPAASIAGNQKQRERLAVIDAMRSFRIRVLVSTDLTARGLDMAHVDLGPFLTHSQTYLRTSRGTYLLAYLHTYALAHLLPPSFLLPLPSHLPSLVINLDVPRSAATYIHRVGRAGRFGGHGSVFTLVAKAREVKALERVARELRATIRDCDDANAKPLGGGGGEVSKSSGGAKRAAVVHAEEQGVLLPPTPAQQQRRRRQRSAPRSEARVKRAAAADRAATEVEAEAEPALVPALVVPAPVLDVNPSPRCIPPQGELLLDSDAALYASWLEEFTT